MRCSSIFTALLVAQSCIDASKAERPVEAQVPSLAINDEEAQLPIAGSQETVLAAIQPHTDVLQAQIRLSAENSTALLGVSQMQEASGFVLKKSLKAILKNVFNTEYKGEEMGAEGENCVESNNCPFTGSLIVTHPKHGIKVGCFEHAAQKVGDMRMNVLHATQIHLKLHVELKEVKIAGVTLDGRINVVINIPSFILRIHKGLSDLDPESAKTWSANIGCFHNRAGGGSLAGAFVEACMRKMPGKVDELVSFLLSKFQPEIVAAINDNVEAATDNSAVKKILATNRGVMVGANKLTKLSTSGQDKLKCVTGRHATADEPFTEDEGEESEDED